MMNLLTAATQYLLPIEGVFDNICRRPRLLTSLCGRRRRVGRLRRRRRQKAMEIVGILMHPFAFE